MAATIQAQIAVLTLFFLSISLTSLVSLLTLLKPFLNLLPTHLAPLHIPPIIAVPARKPRIFLPKPFFSFLLSLLSYLQA